MPAEKQSSFELLFERHPLAMWVFDEETLEFLAVNDAAIARYGYSREEFLEMTADQLPAPGESLPEMTSERLSPDQANRGIPCRHALKNGRVIEVEASWSPFCFEGRAAVLTVINERSGFTDAEQRSQEQADLLDLASDAIMVCDLEGRVTFWNQGAARLYGFSVEETVGADMVELLMPDPSALAETERGVREKGEWSGELHQMSKDKRKLVVNSRWTLVRDHDGEPKSVLVINTDLTETKKLETQFLRAQRLESIGTLASGIAHDLNNILSPILMSVAVLRKSVKEDGQKILNIIESSAERGAGIVKQVLTFARGVEGERVLLQPKHLLSEMGKILAQTFPRNIDIRTQFPADLWLVTGDATQLHQVLLNLCVNARDAMPKGGTLTLAAENIDVDPQFARMNPGAQLGEHVVFRTSDSGMGMSMETMDKIFDPFFTTKEVGKGTGLGLATVMGIVKSHGGFVTVQSEIGSGTTFRIFLPAAAKSPEEEDKKPTTEVSLHGNGELILVVDDEAPIREALVQTLQDYGYRAYTAEDGSDALALFFQRREEIKLVLTDLAMGGMDGIALVRALRKVDPAVKIIVSSGHLQKEQLITLEGLGVKRFLDKPYTAGKLLRLLRDSFESKK